MSVLALVLLVGLSFELVGAFFLAVESIGLKRINSWRRVYLERASEVLKTSTIPESDDSAEEGGLNWLPAALRFSASFLGGTLGILLVGTYFAEAGRLTGGLSAGLLAMLVMALVFFSFPRMILYTTAFLSWIEKRAGDGSIGVIGFLVLAGGFVLQFTATVPLLVAP